MCYVKYKYKTILVAEERRETLRGALIQLCVEMCPLDGPHAIIRTNSDPAFKALLNDELLQRHRISLETGRVKNTNKNPVAKKAIQELEEELLKQEPRGRLVSPKTLSIVTACLNSRIRSRGLSTREMWTQRDQFTNSQVPLADQDLPPSQPKV